MSIGKRRNHEDDDYTAMDGFDEMERAEFESSKSRMKVLTIELLYTVANIVLTLGEIVCSAMLDIFVPVMYLSLMLVCFYTLIVGAEFSREVICLAVLFLLLKYIHILIGGGKDGGYAKAKRRSN